MTNLIFHGVLWLKEISLNFGLIYKQKLIWVLVESYSHVDSLSVLGRDHVIMEMIDVI